MRRLRRNFATVVLIALLVGCIVAVFMTRTSGKPAGPAATTPTSPVDQRLMDTAQTLASVADTPAEQGLAQQALRLADHELDQAFASAIREAAAQAAPTTGPLKDVSNRIAKLHDLIAADQAQIAKLSAGNGDQLELVKAQLALHQDELEDAQQDLDRAGGDRRTQIERAMEEHETSQHKAEQTRRAAAGPTNTMSEQALGFLSLRNRLKDLYAARTQASAKDAALGRNHAVLEGLLNHQPAPQAAASDDDFGEADTAGLLAQMHQLSDQRKTLTAFDKRIEDTRQLADVYARWSNVVRGRQIAVLHQLSLSLAIVVAILLAVVIISRIIRHSFGRRADRKRLHHLRVLSTIAVQFVGVVFILLVIFGPPNQISTIIGLTTAGLTVALKDFIVAICGWFVLMGSGGIHIGDWVEIEGVGGEVIEIGLLKTILLEMGNWANTGHPTGRHVSFVNSFALENHFFNFSTGSQWLWDELNLTLPTTSDPYRMAMEIRDRVDQETAADARLAEEEWERVTQRYGTRTFSAKPAVDLKPSINGLEVTVRYITRAPQRYEVKSRLFESIVDMVHKQGIAAPVIENENAPTQR